MSKFLSMGMSVEDLIERTTSAPAREIGHPELGTLDIGAEADVALLEVQEGDFGFVDCGRAKMIGHKRLRCALTLRAGQVAYDPEGLTMTLWQGAPASYWICK